ncbi:dTDP-4-dehydrorhamnose 3,5-epimerase [Anditalea andensis]|uniref:dTDP-4-dehydrorhamnose 3,5-epimerase n=1 Tax=Anditalea andensis TaxID=1048983 RepID=A0A074KPE1_9BACT|nr:dTDP-4-dehydrorhamnose 3,5-epimerase [Anditalea andensis]KEO71821.1 dTDP-4-dehydrorhamnose 3,5-epimerase [Anditalea andensis]
MKIVNTQLEGCFEIEPKVFGDERGYFYESYNEKSFKALSGIHTEFVQDNQSKSRKGVFRGLHFQAPPFAQAKLVRVISGEVLDVAVDIRAGSPTYGQYHAVLLSAENKKQFFVPRGFAHGFLVLSEEAEFLYKCDDYYHPAAEGGIRYDDPALGIDWKLDTADLLLSPKDRVLPFLSEFESPFIYEK